MLQRYDELEQGTDVWHNLRAENYKTASRTAAILGISPFSNKEKIAQEIKFGVKQFYSKAMQLGNELEDTVRDLVNLEFVDTFMPTVGVNNGYLASLDGINFDEETIIEIKVSDKTYHDLKVNKVPDYYYAQIQHQLMVFDTAKRAYLVAYSPTLKEIVVSNTILRNDNYIKTIKEAWRDFDSYLESYEMPKDNQIEDAEAVNLAMELFEINEQKKKLEEKEKAIKEKLSEVATTDKTVIGNLTISRQKGAKKIDYVKLINDKQVDVSDIDKYTSYNKDSLVFRFSK